MRTATRLLLVVLSLAACGPTEPPNLGLEDEATEVGTVLNDVAPSALYRIHATYDGPPVTEAFNRIQFYIHRQTETPAVAAQLDIDVVVGGDIRTGANGYLPSGNTEQSLVDLSWAWCYTPPCDASGDVEIDLLPASGDENPPVQVGTVTVNSTMTYVTPNPEEDGVLEVTVTRIEL